MKLAKFLALFFISILCLRDVVADDKFILKDNTHSEPANLSLVWVKNSLGEGMYKTAQIDDTIYILHTNLDGEKVSQVEKINSLSDINDNGSVKLVNSSAFVCSLYFYSF